MPICSVVGCDRKVLARGYCNAHYIRWRTTGDTRAHKPLQATGSKAKASPEERFWRNVTKAGPDECWLYGVGDYDGYRTFSLGAKRDGTTQAHRFSFLTHYGSIPDGMVVMHSCDNPRCVNPNHLSLGSYADNMADMDAKGRDKRPTVMGKDNGKAKLTADAVRFIRANPARGHKDLADELGVSPNAVRGVRIGRTWTHIK